MKTHRPAKYDVVSQLGNAWGKNIFSLFQTHCFAYSMNRDVFSVLATSSHHETFCGWNPVKVMNQQKKYICIPCVDTTPLCTLFIARRIMRISASSYVARSGSVFIKGLDRTSCSSWKSPAIQPLEHSRIFLVKFLRTEKLQAATYFLISVEVPFRSYYISELDKLTKNVLAEFPTWCLLTDTYRKTQNF